jgi:tetratricopeptide (TPR) repeat protein
LLNISKEFRTENYDSALVYAKNALKLARSLDFNEGIAKCQFDVGTIYYYRGEYDLTFEAWNEAAEKWKLIKDESSLANCYRSIGIIKSNQGDFKTSIEYYNKALEIGEKINSLNEISSTYNNIGMVYYAQGKYTEALEQYLKALKVNEELISSHNEEDVSKGKTNMAKCY